MSADALAHCQATPQRLLISTMHACAPLHTVVLKVFVYAQTVVSGAQTHCWLLLSWRTLGHAQMVELASKKFICIVDESKLVSGLGGSKGTDAHAPWTCCYLHAGLCCLTLASWVTRRPFSTIDECVGRLSARSLSC